MSKQSSVPELVGVVSKKIERNYLRSNVNEPDDEGYFMRYFSAAISDVVSLFDRPHQSPASYRDAPFSCRRSCCASTTSFLPTSRGTTR